MHHFFFVIDMFNASFLFSISSFDFDIYHDLVSMRINKRIEYVWKYWTSDSKIVYKFSFITYTQSLFILIHFLQLSYLKCFSDNVLRDLINFQCFFTIFKPLYVNINKEPSITITNVFMLHSSLIRLFLIVGIVVVK